MNPERRVTDDPRTWGSASEASINGHRLTIFGATPQHLTIIQGTLAVIPRSHLALVARVVVGDVVGGGAIRNGGNSVRRPPHLRLELSTGAMNNPQKRTAARAGGMIHKTVLHETGHHVDWGCNIMRDLRGPLRDDLDRWFATTSYGGVTTGPGDHFAEAYWRLFAQSSSLPASLRSALAARLGIP